LHEDLEDLLDSGYSLPDLFSITSSIDITGFPEAVEHRGWRSYTTLCCLISQAINASPCFRHRLVDGVLLEFARVHPSINVALEREGFAFADAVFSGRSEDDYASIHTPSDRARQQPVQDFRDGLDDRSSSPTFPG
jgi:chloramphenicol O-acetyltransferase